MDGAKKERAGSINVFREKRLLAYSLAAGTAAVAASDSDATVVYSGEQDISINQFASQAINFDGDEFQDLQLKNYVFPQGNYQGAFIYGEPGKIIGTNAGLNYATALGPGVAVDAAATGSGFFITSLAYGTVNPNAEFNNAVGAFIGLSFPIGGNSEEFLHYAWVRVTIDNSIGSFIVNDWAYNDEPGAPIATGQTADPVLPGDTDGDGDIDDADLGTAFSNFTGPVGAAGGKTIVDGDTDDDGDVDDADLANAFSGFTGPLINTSFVPEPGSLALLAIGAFGLSAYRGRRFQRR